MIKSANIILSKENVNITIIYGDGDKGIKEKYEGEKDIYAIRKATIRKIQTGSLWARAVAYTNNGDRATLCSFFT